jgi:hypothetical protein
LRRHENKLEEISVGKGKYGKVNGYINKKKEFKNKEREDKERE